MDFAQKRSCRPRKSWGEVLENDRKKLGMDSADPQSRSEWRGPFEKDLSKSPILGRGKQGSKMDMMMMPNLHINTIGTVKEVVRFW